MKEQLKWGGRKEPSHNYIHPAQKSVSNFLRIDKSFRQDIGNTMCAINTIKKLKLVFKKVHFSKNSLFSLFIFKKIYLVTKTKVEIFTYKIMVHILVCYPSQVITHIFSNLSHMVLVTEQIVMK